MTEPSDPADATYTDAARRLHALTEVLRAEGDVPGLDWCCELRDELFDPDRRRHGRDYEGIAAALEAK